MLSTVDQSSKCQDDVFICCQHTLITVKETSRDRKFSCSSSDLCLTDLDIDNDVDSDSDFDSDVDFSGCGQNSFTERLLAVTGGVADLGIATSDYGDVVSHPAELQTTSCSPPSPSWQSQDQPVRRAVPRMGTRLLRRPSEGATCCDSALSAMRVRLDSDTSAYLTGHDSGSCSPVDNRVLRSATTSAAVDAAFRVATRKVEDMQQNMTSSQGATDDVMEWVVHRRSDGRRYITRRPASCSKRRRLRRSRHHPRDRKQNDVIAEYRRRAFGASAVDTFTSLGEILAFGEDFSGKDDCNHDRLLNVTAV